MITESFYWKEPLLNGANIIRELMDADDIDDIQFAQIEREIFIGFYAIRKLFEATGKISSETRGMEVVLARYPKRAERPIVDWYNRNEFWDLYDLDRGTLERRDVPYVANQMMHSFIFSLSGNDNGHGAFFTSDTNKENRLSFIRTDEIVRVFEAVGRDYPSTFKTWRDDATGVMKFDVPAKDSVR